MKIDVSNGELFDKLSILEIKRSRGMDVSLEMEKLLKPVEGLKLQYPGVVHLYDIIKSINVQLWDIENVKRSCEFKQDFGDKFKNYSRLVYLINDERARIKKLIDTITESEISEKKSHSSVK